MKNLGKASIGAICLFLMFLLFFESCSEKQDQEPIGDYFVRGKISGQLIDFNVSSTSVVENRRFIGFAGDNPNSNYRSFSFSIESVPIAPGEYKETDPGINMVFRYNVAGTEIYNSQIGTESDFVITITSLVNNTVQGTFKGTLRRENENNQIRSISEGEFRLPID